MAEIESPPKQHWEHSIQPRRPLARARTSDELQTLLQDNEVPERLPPHSRPQTIDENHTSQHAEEKGQLTDPPSHLSPYLKQIIRSDNGESREIVPK